jgi:hypothetical protein
MFLSFADRVAPSHAKKVSKLFKQKQGSNLLPCFCIPGFPALYKIPIHKIMEVSGYVFLDLFIIITGRGRSTLPVFIFFL